MSRSMSADCQLHRLKKPGESLRSFVGARRYVNYLDQDDTRDAALTAAYGPNLRRLQSKYDPDNVFHLNVNISPKA